MAIKGERHGRKSTLVATQLPVTAWHDIIGEKTIADDIFDRIVHTAHSIELKGESMRKANKQTEFHRIFEMGKHPSGRGYIVADRGTQ